MEDSHVRVVESLYGSVWVCQRSLCGLSVGLCEGSCAGSLRVCGRSLCGVSVGQWEALSGVSVGLWEGPVQGQCGCVGGFCLGTLGLSGVPLWGQCGSV